MKVAIITDTHYGARKGSAHLHEYFKLFYDNVFFPTLEKEGIDTIIHMGDIFDSRKSIDYQSLEWSKKNIKLILSSTWEIYLIVVNRFILKVLSGQRRLYSNHLKSIMFMQLLETMTATTKILIM